MLKKLVAAGALAGAVIALGAPAVSAETEPVPVSVFPDLQSARQMCFRGIYDRVWVSCQYRTPKDGKAPETELLVVYPDLTQP